jgi:hypothetical protein
VSAGHYVTKARLTAIADQLSWRQRIVLKDVERLNVLSARQLRTMHYPDSPSGQRLARRELQELVELRLLGRLERRVGGVRAGSDGFVYSLDIAGHRLLRPNRRARAPWTPEAQHLRHALAVSQLYVDLVASSSDHGRLTAFDAEPRCWRDFTGPGGAPLTLKPDASLIIDSPDYEDRWFIELDRATESLPRIIAKAELFIRYYLSGREQAATDVFPQVLWVVPNERRLAQLVEALSNLPPEHWQLFAVTTAENASKQLITGALAPITRKEVT